MPQLTPSQLDHYRERGFVLVEDLLDPTTDIDPVLAEYDEVLDDLAHELFAAGQIASTYADLGFDERLCQIYNETGQVYAQHFDISLPQGGIGPDSRIAVGPAAFAMLRNEKLLDIIENLIGPEIYSNPVQPHPHQTARAVLARCPQRPPQPHRWLCRRCHALASGQRRGFARGRRDRHAHRVGAADQRLSASTAVSKSSPAATATGYCTTASSRASAILSATKT